MTGRGARASARQGVPTRRAVLATGCAAVAAGSGWLLYDDARQSRTATAEARDLRGVIERRGGFRIVMDDLQGRIGPDIMLPDRPVTLVDLGEARLEPLRSLEAALSPYPPGFLPRLLDVVALAGAVVFWGSTKVGGFYFTRGLCLNAGDPADRGSVTTSLFHHELSSLVRAASRFDETRWQSYNPPGFAYLDEAAYRAFLNQQPHAEGSPALHADGFVRPYGTSDLDNDWNTYAEAAFGDAAVLVGLIRHYPRMRAKAAMLISVYEALDPAFGTYFDRVGLRAAAAD